MPNPSNKKRSGGNWDGIWARKETLKKLYFFRKIGVLYIEASGLLSTFFKKYGNKNKKYSVMEFGCGGSSYLPYLKNKYKNLELFGIDKSLNGCKLTIQVIDKGRSSSNIVCGDVLKPPYKSNNFNIVYSVGLIEHFDDNKEVLQRHGDLLKPGGLLICYIPNIVGFQGPFFRFLSQKILPKKQLYEEESEQWIWGMKYISMEDLETWYKEMKLKDIKVSPIGGIFPMIMMESYRPENKSLSVRLTFFIYRFVLFIPFMIINLPFLFRLNSLIFSPFIVAIGKK
jgi:SAM-dependent methyltransferase